jgi:hypothetical protein
VRGYSALFRVFLVWSAFEQLRRIAALPEDSTLLGHYDGPSVDDAIRKVRDGDLFLRAVADELDKRLSKQMVAYLEGSSRNVLVVPRAVRHIFAHGQLTPHSGAGRVAASCEISDLVCQFLFRVMDGEFVRCLRAGGLSV